MRSISITRRLVVSVLLLELLSALALVGVVTYHEHHVQMKAFEASLAAGAESLMGAVQDAEDKDDNVLLDLRTVRVEPDAIYQVEDEHGRILGMAGDMAGIFRRYSGETGFHTEKLRHRTYRFYTLHGLRIIDPGEANGGTSHNITIVYGTPAGRVWHEVLEAIRFVAIATVVLLGATAILMIGLIRRRLSPLHALAVEANRINSGNWHFDAPVSAKEIVELRPLANALESALARVQRSFEQQKRFTSDAAHELKTDVAIVKSSLQLLSMRIRTVEEYSDGLALSLEDFHRLEETVQKLLILARLEQVQISGPLEKTWPFCSLREAVEEAMHQSRSLAQLKDVHVHLELADEAFIPMDRRDAVLISANLLVNALQHSPKHGRVLLSIVHAGTQIVLKVKDWGEGISEVDRPYLFHPFYRPDVSRSRDSGGSGLGLSICKAICDTVGGSIEISNHAEGGALVEVILPSHIGAPAPVLSASLKAE